MSHVPVLLDEVLALVKDSARQQTLRKHLLPLGRPHATSAIVNEVLALARR